MKLLLDTISYNSYIAVKNGNKYNHNFPSNMNIENYVDFIDKNEGNVVLHSATLYELFVKCVKNNSLQGSLKKNNHISLVQFVDDFNGLKRNKIQLMNDTSCYFDWNRIANYCTYGHPFSLGSYIEEKVKYEIYYLSQFYMFVILICGDALFDKYEDRVDVNLFEKFMDLLNSFMKSKISELLNDYYYSNQQKEVAKKSLDYILYYVLVQFEDCVINQSTLVQEPSDVIKYLATTFIKWNPEEIIEGKGAEKAHNIVFDNRKSKNVQTLISTKLDSIIAEMKKADMNPFSRTERNYIIHLLEKLFMNKYKVTKNDFSDYLILTSCDMLHDVSFVGQDIIFITFDQKLKKFIEEHNLYYNRDIYELIYIS